MAVCQIGHGISDEGGLARGDESESSALLKRTSSMPVIYPRPGSGKIPVEQEWTPKRRPVIDAESVADSDKRK